MDTAVLTADVVVFGQSATGLKLLAVKTNKSAFQGKYALPGGKLGALLDDSLLHTANREVREETGIYLDINLLELLEVFDDPHRDTRGRYVSAAFFYLCILNEREMQEIRAGSDTIEVAWIDKTTSLAFDHNEMVQRAWGKFLQREAHKHICLGCRQGWCAGCTLEDKIF